MTPTRQQYRQGARDGHLSALAYDGESERWNQTMRDHEVASFNTLTRACERRGIDTERAVCVYDLHLLLGVKRDADRLDYLVNGDAYDPERDELHAAMAS